jgi:hypothetical protein
LINTESLLKILEVQNERSEVSFYVFTDTNYKGYIYTIKYIVLHDFNSSFLYWHRLNLSERFRKTEVALDMITFWPIVQEASAKRIFESKERFKIKMEDFR